jgi:hypothetical protein
MLGLRIGEIPAGSTLPVLPGNIYEDFFLLTRYCPAAGSARRATGSMPIHRGFLNRYKNWSV